MPPGVSWHVPHAGHRDVAISTPLRYTDRSVVRLPVACLTPTGLVSGARTRTHSGAMMAGPLRAAAYGLSRLFALGGKAGVMSRPGQLWGVCDHAGINGPKGSTLPPAESTVATYAASQVCRDQMVRSRPPHEGC